MPSDSPPFFPRRALLRDLLLCGFAAGLCSLPACGWLDQPLRVAAHVWVGYEPMFMAKNRDWLDPERVSLLQTENSAQTLEALRDGRVEAGALTLDDVLRARAGGLPLTVVLVFNVSLGADMLLVRPGIDRLAQLKGLRLAYEAGSVSAIMLAEILRLAGLTRQDLKLSQVPVGDQVAAWRARQLDACISFEPFASQLLGQGMLRLFDSRQIPNTIIDVLAVRQDALDWRHGAALRELIAAHFRARDALERNPQDASYRMAGHLDLPPSDVLGAFKGLLLPTLANNHQLLAGPTLLRERAQRVSTILRQTGLVSAEDSLAGLIDPGYLPNQGLFK